ncbi:putative pectinesterase/pectinesterase inhibitor 41 [Acorus gramineus]|uniref:Pectinesterase/pectinesterase inhibitor 41 n=1 Tax=Acorus gramineus TaxID=55184 RepID=A0AAV9BQ07_ACOGR|nr:putative pectinesterase/pectinesterase inhibitor 41 [Acorus gramineus]
MASTSFSIFCLILTILSTTSPIQSSAGDVPPTTHITPSAACDSTTYPHFCRSSILPRHGSATLHDYSRLTISQSLSAARRLSSLINSHLARAPSARALQDCAHLSDLSIDYLSEVRAALNSTQPLPDARLDEFKSLLSAVITNHQTCLDALREAPSIRRAFSNGAKLYSVSLSLFARAWVKRRPDNTRSEIVRNGELVAKMSDRHVKIFESWSGRSVVQDPGGMFINDMVVVSKNGTGNFTNITDALGTAPESTSVNDGYFLIYVTAGTYEEYVTVNKTQMFVMMIGDGINRTIITGDHSNSTGWSTFGSATVGGYQLTKIFLSLFFI